jgi:phosphohistidine phosphatase
VSRTLLLLRHAKSSWDDSSVRDHDRPLAPRGDRAARLVAEHLRSEGLRPALVLCSSARRTRDTLELLGPAIDPDADVRIEPDLYGADAGEILDLIRTVDEAVPSVLVIGHNPGLEDLASDLAGDGEEAALDELRTKFPTAALARFDLGRSTWADLGAGAAYLTSLVLPRDLEG